jgi:hypothetical protein
MDFIKSIQKLGKRKLKVEAQWVVWVSASFCFFSGVFTAHLLFTKGPEISKSLKINETLLFLLGRPITIVVGLIAVFICFFTLNFLAKIFKDMKAR